MLGIRLVRMIEAHSEALARGLSEQIRKSDRTSDFRKIDSKDLQLAAVEVYRNLGEWLLQKTESDIETRFRAIAARRAAEQIGLHQFVWAITLTRDHLWRFLRQQGFADTIVELHGEIELQQMLNQFFDRAIYHAIIGYHDAENQIRSRGNLARAQEFAISIGLMSPRDQAPDLVED